MAFTLLKASVYSIVLQQEIDWGAGGEARHATATEAAAAAAATSSAMGSDYDD